MSLLPANVLKKWAAGEQCVAPAEVGAANAAEFVHEAVRAVVAGEITAEHFAQGVQRCGLVARDGVELGSAVADALWLAGAEAEAGSEALKAAAAAAKAAQAAGLCDAAALRARLETEHLDAAGLLPAGGAASWRKKEVRVNTRLRYEQRRFNLLHEESEGWAKLLAALHGRGGARAVRARAGAGGSSSDNAEHATAALVECVQMLVGRFDLDPNRVLDLALDALEAAPGDDALRGLLRAPLLKRAALPHLLGCKFHAHGALAQAGKGDADEQENGEASDKSAAVERPTRPSLYAAAATLVADGAVSVDALYPHLSPTDAEAAAAHALETKAALSAVKATGTVSLAAASASAEEKALAEAKRKKEERARRDAAVARRQANQKLGLAAAILIRGDAWPHARELLRRLEAVDPASHPGIRRALLEQLAAALKPLYAEVSINAKLQRTRDDPAAEEPRSVPGLSHTTFELLAALGSHLSVDIVLLTKACRCLKAHLKRSSEGKPKSAAERAVADVVAKCLLPSASLVACNPMLMEEVWQVLSLLPWGERYRAYATWDSPALAERYPALAAVHVTSVRDVKYVLKRLVPESVRLYGRKFCKAAHACPLPALQQAVKQVEAYPQHTENVVELFKYLTPLSLDVLAYVVVERLGSARDKLKEDGQNIAGWLQCLATFIGHVWRRYSGVDMHGLLAYILTRLRADECLDLVVLQELLARVCNVEWQEELSGDALDKLAGGRTLRSTAVVVTQGMQRGINTVARAMGAMRAALVTADGEDLAVPLLALIGHQRHAAIYAVSLPHLKLVSELVDRSHVCFLQYAEFLQLAHEDVTKYAELLPPLGEACGRLKLEPDTIFHVFRPLLAEAALGKPQAGAEMVSVGGKPVPYDALLETVKGMLPAEVWECLSPELYLTFWSMQLSDVRDLSGSYATGIKATKEALKGVDAAAMPAKNISSAGMIDKAGTRSMDTEKKREREKKRLNTLLEKLQKEADEAKLRCTEVTGSLLAAKKRWLTTPTGKDGRRVGEVHEALLAHCVLPRAAVSQIDAIYAARFVETLVILGTPYFSAFQYYATLLKGVRGLVYTATEYEAGRLGRFLCETLETISRWVDDRESYASKLQKLPAFSTAQSDTKATKGKAPKGADYLDLAKAVTDWYHSMAQSFLAILGAGEYLEMRNALLVLTKMIGVFPKYRTVYSHLERTVAKVKTSDSREDIKVLAARYHGLLQREQREGKLLPFPDSKEALEAEADADEADMDVEEGERPSSKRKAAAQPAAGKSKPAPSKAVVGGGAKGGADRSSERGGRDASRGRERGGEREPRGGPRDAAPRGGPRDAAPRGGPRDATPRGGPRDAAPAHTSESGKRSEHAERGGLGGKEAPPSRQVSRHSDDRSESRGRGGRDAGGGRGSDSGRAMRKDDTGGAPPPRGGRSSAIEAAREAANAAARPKRGRDADEGYTPPHKRMRGGAPPPRQDEPQRRGAPPRDRDPSPRGGGQGGGSGRGGRGGYERDMRGAPPMSRGPPPGQRDVRGPPPSRDSRPPPPRPRSSPPRAPPPRRGGRR